MHADFTRQLQIVWIALLLGVALFLSVSLYVGPDIQAAEDFPGDLFFGLTAAASLIGIVVGFGIQRRMMAGRFIGKPLPQGVMTDFILSIAPLEGSAFLALVGFLLTQQALLLAFLVPFFAFGLLFFPTRARLGQLTEAAEATYDAGAA